MSDTDGDHQAQIDGDAFLALIRETIPRARDFPVTVERIEYGSACLRLEFQENMVRAGGTVSGPTLMTLADTAMYAAVLSAVGAQSMAVTTDLHIRFLRRPGRRALIAKAQLMKLGRLTSGEVTIYSEGEAQAVAHVTAAYAVPRVPVVKAPRPVSS